jgi:hypothetical protein
MQMKNFLAVLAVSVSMIACGHIVDHGETNGFAADSGNNVSMPNPSSTGTVSNPPQLPKEDVDADAATQPSAPAIWDAGSAIKGEAGMIAVVVGNESDAGHDAVADAGSAADGAPSAMPVEAGSDAMPPNIVSVKLAAGTPQQSIVASSVQWGDWYYFSEYVLTNPGDADESISLLTVEQPSPGGTFADFTDVNVSVCVQGVVSSPGLTHVAEGSYIDPFHVNSKAHFKDGPSMLFDLGGGMASFTIPAHGELHICLTGLMAETESSAQDAATPGRGPRSGDTPGLRIAAMELKKAESVVKILQPNNPPTMVLRKAVPTISWEQPVEPLHEGENVAARLTIHADPDRLISYQQIMLYVLASRSFIVDETVLARLFMKKQGDTHEVPFIWEESIPRTEFRALLCLIGEDVIQPGEYVTYELRVPVKTVMSGDALTTRMMTVDSFVANWSSEVITTSLQLFNGNGILMETFDGSPWPYRRAGMWWSDLAEDPHQPFVLTAPVVDPGFRGQPSSRDFTDQYLVPGSDESVSIVAP